MVLRLSGVSFCIIISSALSGATLRADTIRTWDEFTNAIGSHDVKSVDDLLSALPADFLQGHTFVYRSKALHRELVSEKATSHCLRDRWKIHFDL